MERNRLTPRMVDQFIRVRMRKALRKDLLSHKMLGESDLECRVYHQLRKFLRRDGRWKVFTRRFWKSIGRYPDVTILEDHKRRFALELKWREEGIPKKDRSTLRSCLSQMKRFRVYFITTVISGSDYAKRSEKKPEERNRMKEITIKLDLKPRRLERWRRERGEYKRSFR